MTQPIPAEFLDLFTKPAFANLATLMKDGTPQNTPVWVDYDGEYVLVNSAHGRVKNRNMPLGAPVSITIVDPENPYRYLMVRGRVAVITDWRRPAEVREIFKIAAEKVVTRQIATQAFYNERRAAIMERKTLG